MRLRTTTNVYANRLFLTLIAVLLDVAWRLLRRIWHGANPERANLGAMKVPPPLEIVAANTVVPFPT